MMEVAGELVAMSLDPELEESWQQEIAEVIENNFPEVQVSALAMTASIEFDVDLEQLEEA